MGTLCCHKEETQTEKPAVELVSPCESLTVKSFQVERLLGKGAFGKVLLVSKRDTAQQYAMKVINKAKLKSAQLKSHAVTERKILERVQSLFVVRLHFAFQSDDKLYMVMDYMSGGSLMQLLRKVGRLHEDAVRFYIAEVLLALEALHANCIIYRDLKPENILFDSEGHLKLADFNLSKLTDCEIDRSFTFCGTPDYVAPEVLRGEAQDQAVDFWALGVLMYEMLAGRAPWANPNRDLMYKNIVSQPAKMLGFFSPKVKDLLRHLLQVSKSFRLADAQEAMQHPFFASVNWTRLREKKVPAPCRPTGNDTEESDSAEDDVPIQSSVFDQFTYEESKLA